jgi:ParB-like chromosome segregation protein Spo0J
VTRVHKPGTDPVDQVVWRPVEELRTNAWNPNVVHSPELKLLETSILEVGWVQPILTSADGLVIDGENRLGLAKSSKAIKARYGGKVPCAVLDIDEPHAMLLTVRINRAKGTHVAVRMSDLVQSVINDHGIDPDDVARLIGASRAEVDLLLQDDVFKARNIPTRSYSKAWVPEEVPS